MFDPEEVPAVLQRALDRDVLGVLVPATGPGDLESTVRLIEQHPDRIVGAVGIHPHEASAADAGVKHDVERLLSTVGVVAVGEIGLVGLGAAPVLADDRLRRWDEAGPSDTAPSCGSSGSSR